MSGLHASAMNEPPLSDELEVSLFGPGFGECVVIHLGNQEWMIIDSCLNETQDNPIAVEYLDSIGVDLANSVRIILASHFDDDHIAGMSSLMRHCRQAKFYMSAALHTKEFTSLVVARSKYPSTAATDTGARNLTEVFATLRDRDTGPGFCLEDKIIFRGKGNNACEVLALSPSNEMMARSNSAIAQMYDECLEFRGKSVCKDANNFSVAVLIRLGSVSLLLGGDLLNATDASIGWKAVINMPIWDTCKASAFKVAHHGSRGAQHDELWSTSLVLDPVAMLTPFRLGNVQLPTEGEINYLKSKTASVYCTTSSTHRRAKRRGNGVDKMIEMVAKGQRQRARNRKPGHIRYRCNSNDASKFKVETFCGAVQL